MKINNRGKELIGAFRDSYEPTETLAASKKAVKMYVKRSLTDNQYSALVSLVLCIGIDDFRTSKLLKLLNTRGLTTCIEAANCFDYYIYEINDLGQRVVDPFLVQQREMEKALFLTPEIVKNGGKTNA